eukprot:tig00001049_g6679.t1
MPAPAVAGLDDVLDPAVLRQLRPPPKPLAQFLGRANPADALPPPSTATLPIDKALGTLQEKLQPTAFRAELLKLGQRLEDQRQYRLAHDKCYAACLQALEQDKTATGEGPALEQRVVAMTGAARCNAGLALLGDVRVKRASTFRALLEALTQLRAAGELAVAHEELAWRVYNVTVAMEAVYEPLVTLPYAKDVVEFALWAALAMESSAALLNTRYLPWRVRLYTLVARCYDDLRAYPHALKWCELCLRKLEELEGLLRTDIMPVSPEDAAALAAGAWQLRLRVFRFGSMPGLFKDAKALADAHAALFASAPDKLTPLAFALPDSFGRVLRHAPPPQERREAVRALFAMAEQLLAPHAHTLTLYYNQRHAAGLPLPAAPAAPAPAAKAAAPAKEAKDGKGTAKAGAGAGAAAAAAGPAGPEAAGPAEVTEEEAGRAMAGAPLEAHVALLKAAYGAEEWATVAALAPLLLARLAPGREADAHPRGETLRWEAELVWRLYELQHVSADRAADLGRLGRLLREGLAGGAIRERQDMLVDATLNVWLNCRQLLASLEEAWRAQGALYPDPTAPLLAPQAAASIGALTGAATVGAEGGGEVGALGLATELVAAVYGALLGAGVDDVELLVGVAARLAALHEHAGRYSRAAQALRPALDALDAHRAEWAEEHGATLASVTAAPRPLALRALHEALAAAPAPPHKGGAEGVAAEELAGAGAEDGQEGEEGLWCEHVDLLARLYRCELALAARAAREALLRRHERREAERGRREAMQDVYGAITDKERRRLEEAAAAEIDDVRSDAGPGAAAEARLLRECGHNAYQRAVLLMSLAPFRKTGKEQVAALEEAAAALEAAAAEEAALLRALVAPAPAGASPRRPRRGSSCGRRRRWRLNNTELAGTGSLLPLPAGPRGLGRAGPFFVRGLTPNEAYAFAFGAHDARGACPGGIGETGSPAIVALHPLPLLFCWGYLALQANRLGATPPLRRAAQVLYETLVSAKAEAPLHKLNPAVAHRLSQPLVSQMPGPLVRVLAQVLMAVAANSPVERPLAGPEDGFGAGRGGAMGEQVGRLKAANKLLMALRASGALRDHALTADALLQAYRLLAPLLAAFPAGPPRHLLQALLECRAAAAALPPAEVAARPDLLRATARFSYYLLLAAAAAGEAAALPALARSALELLPRPEAEALGEYVASLGPEGAELAAARAPSGDRLALDVWRALHAGGGEAAMAEVTKAGVAHPRFLELAALVCQQALAAGQAAQVEPWAAAALRDFKRAFSVAAEAEILARVPAPPPDPSAPAAPAPPPRRAPRRRRRPRGQPAGPGPGRGRAAGAPLVGDMKAGQLEQLVALLPPPLLRGRRRAHFRAARDGSLRWRSLLELSRAQLHFSRETAPPAPPPPTAPRPPSPAPPLPPSSRRRRRAPSRRLARRRPALRGAAPGEEEGGPPGGSLACLARAVQKSGPAAAPAASATASRSTSPAPGKHGHAPASAAPAASPAAPAPHVPAAEGAEAWRGVHVVAGCVLELLRAAQQQQAAAGAPGPSRGRLLWQRAFDLAGLRVTVAPEGGAGPAEGGPEGGRTLAGDASKKSLASTKSAGTRAGRTSKLSRRAGDEGEPGASGAAGAWLQAARELDVDLCRDAFGFCCALLVEEGRLGHVPGLVREAMALTGGRFAEGPLLVLARLEEEKMKRMMLSEHERDRPTAVDALQLAAAEAAAAAAAAEAAAAAVQPGAARRASVAGGAKGGAGPAGAATLAVPGAAPAGEGTAGAAAAPSERRASSAGLTEAGGEERRAGKALSGAERERVAEFGFEAELSARVAVAYDTAIGVLREKRETALLLQALGELADFYLAHGLARRAHETWAALVDAAFGVLGAASQWRALLAKHPAPLASLGLGPCLLAAVALARIAKHCLADQEHARLQHALFAAALVRALFSCSVEHPQEAHLFAGHRPRQLWPGVNLLGDGARVKAGPLLEALDFLSSALVEAGYFAEALPVATLQRHVAEELCGDVQGAVLAKLAKLAALTQGGFIAEAAALLAELLEGRDLPSGALYHEARAALHRAPEAPAPAAPPPPPSPPPQGPRPGAAGGAAAGAGAAAGGPRVRYRNDRPPEDAGNEAAIRRLNPGAAAQYGPGLAARVALGRAALLLRVAATQELAVDPVARGPDGYPRSAAADPNKPPTPAQAGRGAGPAETGAGAVVELCLAEAEEGLTALRNELAPKAGLPAPAPPPRPRPGKPGTAAPRRRRPRRQRRGRPPSRPPPAPRAARRRRLPDAAGSRGCAARGRCGAGRGVAGAEGGAERISVSELEVLCRAMAGLAAAHARRGRPASAVQLLELVALLCGKELQRARAALAAAPAHAPPPWGRRRGSWRRGRPSRWEAGRVGEEHERLALGHIAAQCDVLLGRPEEALAAYRGELLARARGAGVDDAAAASALLYAGDLAVRCAPRAEGGPTPAAVAEAAALYGEAVALLQARAAAAGLDLDPSYAGELSSVYVPHVALLVRAEVRRGAALTALGDLDAAVALLAHAAACARRALHIAPPDKAALGVALARARRALLARDGAAPGLAAGRWGAGPGEATGSEEAHASVAQPLQIAVVESVVRGFHPHAAARAALAELALAHGARLDGPRRPAAEALSAAATFLDAAARLEGMARQLERLGEGPEGAAPAPLAGLPEACVADMQQAEAARRGGEGEAPRDLPVRTVLAYQRALLRERAALAAGPALDAAVAKLCGLHRYLRAALPAYAACCLDELPDPAGRPFAAPSPAYVASIWLEAPAPRPDPAPAKRASPAHPHPAPRHRPVPPRPRSAAPTQAAPAAPAAAAKDAKGTLKAAPGAASSAAPAGEPDGAPGGLPALLAVEARRGAVAALQGRVAALRAALRAGAERGPLEAAWRGALGDLAALLGAEAGAAGAAAAGWELAEEAAALVADLLAPDGALRATDPALCRFLHTALAPRIALAVLPEPEPAAAAPAN